MLGSTSGIGRAVALCLAEAGVDVVIHGRSESKGREVAALAASRNVRTHLVMADLADRSASDRLLDEAWSVWGGLDAWLHVAGADVLTGPGRRSTFEEKLDALLAVDVVSTIRLAREVGRRMKARGGGSIVTMGWDQAETGMEGDSGELFAATKAAIMGFTKSLAVSLAPAVRVNAIAPGWIKTSWGDHAPREWVERVMRETPLGRWGTVEDVAQVARFLVSPAASFMTGQVIRVNGGAVRL